MVRQQGQYGRIMGCRLEVAGSRSVWAQGHRVVFTDDGGAISCGGDGQLLRWNLETGASSRVEWPSEFVPTIETRFSRGFRAFHALAICHGSSGDLVVTGGENGVLFHDLR